MFWNTQSYLFLGRELISFKLSEWCVWLFHTCGTRKGVPLSSPGHPATKVFVPMAQASRWRKRIVVQSKIDPWVYILVFAEGNSCRFAASNGQDSLKASPRVIFNWKNFIEQPNLILKWMLIERWGRLSMLNSMCQHVARLQFDYCAEKRSLCGTVMIHDGLDLACLDQCHGVRFHGRSSSQRWRKRLVVQSKFDPWVYILVFAEGI